jgi:hypothetical protein
MQVALGQLARRHAKQSSRAERAQAELNARLAPIVCDDRGPGVQAAHDGLVDPGGLSRIGMSAQDEGVVEREDERN